MRRILTPLLIFTALCAFAAPAPAQDQARDWLVNPDQYVAEVQYDKQANELRLNNGLVERRIILSPNAATVSLKNLATGEEFVRAPSPEARVVIDGESFPVGGITPGPVANYWKEEWHADARPLDFSYRYDRFETGEIEERFPWKKRPEWLSRDLPWPPKGKRVSLFFLPPLAVPAPTEGEKLFEETFLADLDASWKTVLSPLSPKISFANEGKQGEIFAPSETCAYVERNWVPGAVALQVRLDVGNETYANSWGPGLALVFPGNQIVSVVARPYSREYELCVNGVEKLVGNFNRDKEITLTAQFLGSTGEGSAAQYELVLEGSQETGKTEIGRLPVKGLPELVRVGKVGKGGYGKDFAKATASDDKFARVHINNVAFFDPIPDNTAKELAPLPEIEVRYEIYDGAPLISKQLFARAPESVGDREFVLNSFVNEELRLVEAESDVEARTFGTTFNMSILSDYTFGGIKPTYMKDSEAYRVKPDPSYPTQVNYGRRTPCLLECAPELGPAQIVAKDRPFESNTIWELLHDQTDRERRGLAYRRAFRILAPWIAENPLMFHKINSKPEEVRDGIKQCQETGFEIFIMSFGSGFNLESRDEKYRELYRGLSREAQAVGVALGGYSLTSSRNAGTPGDNVRNPSPKFGRGPCLGSAWGRDYLQALKDFMEIAEFGVFENDGPFPGDFCEATDHPGHHGKDDSVWVQWQAQSDLYKWCRARGVYVNQPDGYFLQGGSKTGMGYRETNWSLPRAEQVIIERQNVYDGTWDKTQSMGWMFVPLSQYHGGGAAATIEPLKDHLDHYDHRFADLIGAGVQACWRGPRLYDSEETKAVVCKWVGFYKKYRRILDADLIHLRRPTGRDWDGWLHVDSDPDAEIRGLAFFYNPTQEEIRREIVVPLYYAGLSDKALLQTGNSDLQLGETSEIVLNERHEAVVEIVVPAESYSWAIFRDVAKR